MRALSLFWLSLLAACPSAHAPQGVAGDPAARFVLSGARLPGGQPVDILVERGRILAVGELEVDAPEVAAAGRYVVPSFVDSHVHLAYWRVAPELAARGVAAAVDLGAPLGFLASRPADLRVLASGPLLTAPHGYPTRGWGRDGYGLECAGPDEVRAAVRLLAERGCELVKLAVTGAPALDEASLRAACQEARRLGLKSAAHALSDAQALLAGRVGVDLLAHTPVEALAAETVAAWKGRAVVSTLACFGGGEAAVSNLRRLRQAGVVVLYGTDLGNTRTAGIDADELELLLEAGLSPQAILDAGTSAPAAYFGLDELGALAPGKAASFLLVERDPLTEPLVLARPAVVYRRGELLAAPGR